MDKVQYWEQFSADQMDAEKAQIMEMTEHPYYKIMAANGMAFNELTRTEEVARLSSTEYEKLMQLTDDARKIMSLKIESTTPLSQYMHKFRVWTHLFFSVEELVFEKIFRVYFKFIEIRARLPDEGEGPPHKIYEFSVPDIVDAFKWHVKLRIGDLITGVITSIDKRTNKIQVAINHEIELDLKKKYTVKHEFNYYMFFAIMRTVWLMEREKRGIFAAFPDASDLETDVEKFQRQLNRQYNNTQNDKKTTGDQHPTEVKKYNMEQSNAIHAIVSGSHGKVPFVLWGPPGTGKTACLIECVRQILQKDTKTRILFCTPSNTAADLVAGEILKEAAAKASEMRRYYSLGKHVSELDQALKEVVCIRKRPDFGVMNDQFCLDPFEWILENIRLVVCTISCTAYFDGQMEDNFFTHIFIDEAAQSLEPDTMLPITRFATEKTRIVLCGDHRQLGPVIKATFLRKFPTCELSLMERLIDTKSLKEGSYRDKRTHCKLVDSYRCHPAIIEFPSKKFYNEMLRSVCKRDSLCQWKHLPTKRFPIIYHIMSDGKEIAEHDGHSFYNLEEVEAVLEYIQQLVYTTDVTYDQIGVISPYKQQAQKIRSKLQKFNRSAVNVTVDSVERYQGSERRVIIITTTRSKEIGFLSEIKRLNTCLTRAQDLMIVISSERFIELIQTQESWGVCWNSFYEYCARNGAIVYDTIVGLNGPYKKALKINIEDPNCDDNLLPTPPDTPPTSSTSISENAYNCRYASMSCRKPKRQKVKRTPIEVEVFDSDSDASLDITELIHDQRTAPPIHLTTSRLPVWTSVWTSKPNRLDFQKSISENTEEEKSDDDSDQEEEEIQEDLKRTHKISEASNQSKNNKQPKKTNKKPKYANITINQNQQQLAPPKRTEKPRVTVKPRIDMVECLLKTAEIIELVATPIATTISTLMAIISAKTLPLVKNLYSITLGCILGAMAILFCAIGDMLNKVCNRIGYGIDKLICVVMTRALNREPLQRRPRNVPINRRVNNRRNLTKVLLGTLVLLGLLYAFFFAITYDKSRDRAPLEGDSVISLGYGVYTKVENLRWYLRKLYSENKQNFRELIGDAEGVNFGKIADEAIESYIETQYKKVRLENDNVYGEFVLRDLAKIYSNVHYYRDAELSQFLTESSDKKHGKSSIIRLSATDLVIHLGNGNFTRREDMRDYIRQEMIKNGAESEYLTDAVLDRGISEGDNLIMLGKLVETYENVEYLDLDELAVWMAGKVTIKHRPNCRAVGNDDDDPHNRDREKLIDSIVNHNLENDDNEEKNLEGSSMNLDQGNSDVEIIDKKNLQTNHNKIDLRNSENQINKQSGLRTAKSSGQTCFTYSHRVQSSERTLRKRKVYAGDYTLYVDIGEGFFVRKQLLRKYYLEKVAKAPNDPQKEDNMEEALKMAFKGKFLDYKVVKAFIDPERIID